MNRFIATSSHCGASFGRSSRPSIRADFRQKTSRHAEDDASSAMMRRSGSSGLTPIRSSSGE
jgi:hypothetical protein